MNVDPKKYRLGNLLREVNSGKIVEVIGLKKEIHQKTGFHEEPINYENLTVEVSGNFPDGWRLEEIPLTEEIILKIGLVKDNFRDKRYYCAQLVNPLAFGAPYVLSKPMDFVSEIQNFFFYNTGKELDVSALHPEPIPAP